MAYSEKELEDLQGWIYMLAGELEELKETDSALMFGIELGDDDLQNRSILPLPGKFAAPLKTFLIQLYEKDIQMLTNLTANISKVVLAGKLAKDYKKIANQIEEWNNVKRKKITLKAIFGKKAAAILPVPAQTVTSVVSLMIADLTKEKEIIEQRIILLADLDTSQPAEEIIRDLNR